MSYDQVKEKNLKFFSGLLEESEDEHHVVAQSKLSHMKRFEKILELGDFNHKRLLDVGCGIGGLSDFLEERGIRCHYTGIDINPGMIALAKEKHPGIKDRFFVFDILETDLEQRFDYVVSNGPLNLKFEGTMNMDMTVKILGEMYRLSQIGMMMTMTSSFTRKPNEETFYYDPAVILAKTFEFCVNTRLDHTYLPHDFAIFCYKKDLYDF